MEALRYPPICLILVLGSTNNVESTAPWLYNRCCGVFGFFRKSTVSDDCGEMLSLCEEQYGTAMVRAMVRTIDPIRIQQIHKSCYRNFFVRCSHNHCLFYEIATKLGGRILNATSYHFSTQKGGIFKLANKNLVEFYRLSEYTISNGKYLPWHFFPSRVIRKIR